MSDRVNIVEQFINDEIDYDPFVEAPPLTTAFEGRPAGSRPDGPNDNRAIKTSDHPLSPAVNPWSVAGMHMAARDLIRAANAGYADGDLDGVIAAATARKALLAAG